MKHLILYESFSSATQIPLPKKKRKEYIKELSKHITFPEAYEEDPDAWCALVVERLPVVGDDTSSRQFSKENVAKMEKYLKDEIDGTPQMDYNDFFAHAAEIGGIKDLWEELDKKPIERYKDIFEQPDEVLRMMKAVRDNIEMIEWVTLK